VKRAGRIVIKIGSSTLTRSEGGLDFDYISNLAEQVSRIRRQGWETILVTSGAIAAGVHRLGLPPGRPRTMPLKQAAAAVGQGLLMQAYAEAFQKHQMVVAQVLLTRDDFQERGRFLNARNTLSALLKLRAVPIINENDTVAVDEIRIGDNDTLAAQVAAAVSADILLILSDVDGFLDAEGRVVPVIQEITPEMTALAGDTNGTTGTGGMKTKLEAAYIAASAGVDVVIANGRRPEIVVDTVRGLHVGTKIPSYDRLSSRKHWLAFNLPVRGVLYVNQGAMERIVGEGKSLLPSGVVGTEGDFEAGDLVCLSLPSGEEFARGLSNYSSKDVELIKGCHTREIAKILGRKDFDEVVHRDNMIVSRHSPALKPAMTSENNKR
jgi:glutamate 5-kinase